MSRKKSARPDRPVSSGRSEEPPGPPRVGTAKLFALCAVLVVVTFAAFGRLPSNGFVGLDDGLYVTQNSHVQQGLTLSSIAWAFTTTAAANWHPVTWASHMLDVTLFGLDAGRHHGTSLLLHAANTVLLLLLLLRMTGALWRSALVAALFALHPLHVESVAWIAERKDVLSTLFWLSTVLAWLAYVKSKKTGPYLLALLFFALGLMAKPMLVTLPFTLLLLDFWPLDRMTAPARGRWETIRELLFEKAPLFALSAASVAVTLMAQRTGGAVQTMQAFPFGERLANAVDSCVTYLAKAFWPSPLSVFYPHPHAGWTTARSYGAVLLLAIITLLAFRFARRAPFFVVGWLGFLGTLVPVIGLVQIGGQAMADRYTYVPLIGIFVLFAWGLAELVAQSPTLRTIAIGLTLVWLALLFGVTRDQTRYWANPQLLFEHALAVTSENEVAELSLAITLSESGRNAEALPHYEEAVRIDPSYTDARIHLAKALISAGRADEATEQCVRARESGPADPESLSNLGVLFLTLNRANEAIDCFEKTIEKRPDFAEAYSNLGIALVREGRLPEALARLEEGARLNPDSARILDGLGLALASARRLPEATERFEQALQKDPNLADAHFHLAMALGQQNRQQEALEHLRETLRIRPDYAPARAILERISGAQPEGQLAK
jgi:tetratricopeptide (TPR) repeat protein